VAEPTILVFGATGALGGHVLEGLIARGVAPATVTAAGRNPSRLAELGKSGFATAKIDMSDSARVADVVAGHRRVVLISGRDPNRLDQHTAVIKAATKAQVEHVYYTSGLRADDVRFEIGADHKATEDALIASGVTYTILRNGWYIENYIQAMAGPRYTGILAAAVGDAVIAPASRRDLADALAAVVMTDGHDNVTYNLSGDTDFTYADIAQAMSIASRLGGGGNATPFGQIMPCAGSGPARFVVTHRGRDWRLPSRCVRPGVGRGCHPTEVTS